MAAKKSKKERMKEAASKKIDAVNVVQPEEKEKVSVISLAQQSVICEDMTTKDTVMVVLYSVLLFLAMTVQTGTMSMVLTVLALVSLIGKKPLENLREHLSLPVIGLVAFAWMCGAASLYSRFGTDAAAELYKLMASFSVAVILLARFEKKHVRGLLWGFVAVCAVIALVCVDMGSWGKLYEVFCSYAQALGGDFSGVVDDSRNSGRITGIYNDANLTGALLGMAILLSVYLAHTAKKLSGRFWALTALGVSAVSFLMAVSRGAMLVFGIAVLVYFVAEGGKTRTELLFLLLTAGGISAVAGVVAMMNLGQGEILPVLLTVIAGPAAFVVDWGVTGRIAHSLRGREKLTATVGGVTIVALLCVAVAAFWLTEPFVFDGSTLHRGLVPTPGQYTVSGDWETEEPITLTVIGYSQEQALLGEITILYNGEIDTAEFTVPEDMIWIRLSFFAPAGVLRQVFLSDGTEIPLVYTLVPEFIVRRLQDGGLRGGNFQQRLQYLRDGMTIFKQSPLIGHGLGSTAAMLMKVQPYHYESLYIHNHVIQVMDEMGVVGLAAFLLLLLGSLALLILRRLKSQDSLAAVLIACWVMMNLHSFMEINFSVRMYQCAAFFILMIPVLLYAKGAPQRWSKLCGYAALAIVCLQLAVFGSLLRGYRTVQKDAAFLNAANAEAFMSSLQSFVERDPYDNVTHRLNYVANAAVSGNPAYNDKMHEYVEDLYNTGTYAAYMGLAQHYYLTIGDWQEMFACSRLAAAQVPTDSEAWNMQVDFYRKDVLPLMREADMADFMEGLSYFVDALERVNDRLWDGIVLEEENQIFLQRVLELSGSGCSDEEIYRALIA